MPDVCTVLHNARGTAPGMWFSPEASGSASRDSHVKTRGAVYISLPGVPHEMKGLMIDQVIPGLLDQFDLPAILHRTAFTSGVGESMVAEHIKDFETAFAT